MNLIVGLGNTGEKYEKTRHNVGFMVLDELARQMVNGQWSMVKKLQSSIVNYQSSIILAKPQTMMNDSGKAVKKIIAQYKIDLPNLWVIHDDLDLKLGEYKIQKGKGPREHKGLQSVYEEIGSKDFWHVRVGVDNRAPENRTPGEQYVLQDFTKKEREVIDEVIGNVANKIIDSELG